MNSIISLAEKELIDAWFDDPTVSVFDFLVNYNVDVESVYELKRFYTPQYNELFLDDPDILEGYGDRLLPLRTFFTKMFDDFELYLR